MFYLLKNNLSIYSTLTIPSSRPKTVLTPLNQAGWVKGARVIKICPCVSLCDSICPKGWKSYQTKNKKEWWFHEIKSQEFGWWAVHQIVLEQLTLGDHVLGPPQCQLPGCLHNLGMAKLALLSRAVGVKTVGCPKITADTNADKDLLTQKCLFSPLMIVKSVQSARLWPVRMVLEEYANLHICKDWHLACARACCDAWKNVGGK